MTSTVRHRHRRMGVTVRIMEAGGGQWMFTIATADGTTLSRSTPYINKRDARRAADRIVEAFGAGTILD